MRYPTLGTNTPPSFVNVDMSSCSTDGDLPSFTEGMAGLMHTHNNASCNGGTPIKVPSPTDIQTFLNTLLPEAGQYAGGYDSAYSIVATSGGNYMIAYSGTNYPGSMNYNEWKSLNKSYTDAFQNLYSDKENVTQADLERVFTKFMKEEVNREGLEIYKVTANSSTKLEYNPNSPNMVTTVPCPNF
ncbi:hypothetical protein BN1195_01494 [Chryseobacterium oranimense G311]|uniref:hypothetical protein n=1 Tax=Chryseobacterium oranimense TaxID=421058 RepID=UPI0005339A20|nr:hypothetical protein [Chryseobacterium oranimense]CEJ69197.1 hypothetical protein BN1195_01494 [Chryseobacterium oranimense G311]